MSVQVKKTLPGTGTVTEEFGAHLDHLPLFAESFRAPGFTDKQTLTDAFAAWIARGGELWLDPGRVYDLGEVSESPSAVFQLSGLRNAALKGNGCTFQVETANNADYVVLYCYNYVGVIDVDPIYERAVNSSNLAVAVSGLTNQLVLTWTGSDYAAVTAYARVEAAWISRPGAR